jgi:uncharacterized protein (TIRG00374 family)
MQSRNKASQVKRIARWVASLALIAYILSQMSLPDLAREFGSLIYAPLVAALLLKVLLRILVAAKWFVIVRIRDRLLSFWRALAVHFVGGAVGTVLPMVGVDLTVGYAYYKRSMDAAAAISSVMIDRLIGLYMTILMAAIGLALAHENLAAVPGLSLLTVGAVVAALLSPVIFGVLFRFRRILIRSWMPKKIAQLLREIRIVLGDYGSRGRAMLGANVGLSFITQFVRVLSTYALALAVGADPAFFDFLALVPLIFLALMIPITGASVGMEPAAFIVAFGLVGIGPEKAFAMAMIGKALSLLAATPGVIILLFGGESLGKPVTGEPPQGQGMTMESGIRREKTD